jgi:DNA-binding NarL/FixJ family response regulator
VLGESDVDVVGQVPDADALVEALEESSPDVVILDARIACATRPDGGTVVDRLRQSGRGVLVLSPDVETAAAVGSEPGVGNLLKDRIADPAELADAIRRVVRGETVVDAQIVSGLVKRGRSETDRLTRREREVLALMAEGRSNQGIGERLFLGPKAVETHVRNIFMKLSLEPAADDHRRVLAVIAYLRSAR